MKAANAGERNPDPIVLIADEVVVPLLESVGVEPNCLAIEIANPGSRPTCFGDVSAVIEGRPWAPSRSPWLSSSSAVRSALWGRSSSAQPGSAV